MKEIFNFCFLMFIIIYICNGCNSDKAFQTIGEGCKDAKTSFSKGYNSK